MSFADIGDLNEQIRDLREVIELPLTNPELFIRVGIKVSLEKCQLYPTNLTLAWVICSMSHILLFVSLYAYRPPKVSCCMPPLVLEKPY